MEKMPIPEGLDVLQSGDAVVIRRRWRTFAVIPMFFFLVFWFGFLGFWYYHAFTDPHAPLVMFLFPLLHLAAGLAIAYFAISSLVNRTDVIISTSRVKSVTGPLPWWGNCDVPAEGIRGIAVVERLGNQGQAGGRNLRYVVMYVDAANKERMVVQPVPYREQADFIAASIRDILGLKGKTQEPEE